MAFLTSQSSYSESYPLTRRRQDAHVVDIVSVPSLELCIEYSLKLTIMTVSEGLSAAGWGIGLSSYKTAVPKSVYLGNRRPL